MEDFNSKYTGQEVEQLLDQVANGDIGGSSLANVQAIETIKDDDSWYGEVRPIRDAKDLTTGEKVYFVGHTKSIFTSNNARLQDELDDIRVLSVPCHLEVEATEEPGEIPMEFLRSLYDGGTPILNGGIASLNADQSIITSIKSVENILTITKIYRNIDSITAYDKITIDEYDMDNLGSGGVGTINWDNIQGKPNIYNNSVGDLFISSDNSIFINTKEGYDTTINHLAVQNIIKFNDLTLNAYDQKLEIRDSMDDEVLTLVGDGDGTKFLSDDGKYKPAAYPIVNHGSSDTTFVLTPNIYHVWDEVETLNLTLGDAIDGVMSEYTFQFISGSAETVLTLPDSIKWANDDIPDFDIAHIYQISIVNNCACYLKFVM